MKKKEWKTMSQKELKSTTGGSWWSLKQKIKKLFRDPPHGEGTVMGIRG